MTQVEDGSEDPNVIRKSAMISNPANHAMESEHIALIFLTNYACWKKQKIFEMKPSVLSLLGVNHKKCREQVRGAAFLIYNHLHGTSASFTSPLEDHKKVFGFYQEHYALMQKDFLNFKEAAKNVCELAHGKCTSAKNKDSKQHKSKADAVCYQNSKEEGTYAEDVANPVAMPVEVARYEDLEPFFSALQRNQPAVGKQTDDLGSYDQYQKGAHYTDGRIDLCKQVVGPDHIQALLNSIAMNSYVKHFLLGNNIIGRTGAEAIARFITLPLKSCHISTWYLAGNAFDGESASLIAKSLENDEDCRQLWLKRNPIKTQGAIALANMLRSNKHLQVLDLDNTGIMDEGCIAIFQALKFNQTLESLYLDANGITSASIPAMIEYFQHKNVTGERGISRLWIGMNRLKDWIRLLMPHLKEYPLQTFCANSNRIELDGLSAILENLPSTLKFLDLGYYKATADLGELPNSFGDQGAKLIADFLFTNPSLMAMAIDNSHISADGLGLIAASLRFNHNLLHLSYGQGGIMEDAKSSSRDHGRVILQRCRMNSSIHRFGSEEEYKQYLRRVKHGDHIWVIDSIYRNRM